MENLQSIPNLDSLKVVNKESLHFNNAFVIDINEIIKVVSNLKANKTGGVDGFNSSVLKGCVNGVAIPLYLNFKQSMSSSIIPLD